MSTTREWNALWQRLLARLAEQPPCPLHPEYPAVRTLARGQVNDIIRMDESGVVVRSHGSMESDPVPVAHFRALWKHLGEHGHAVFEPGCGGLPAFARSRIIGAILVTCLPEVLRYDGREIVTRKR